MTVYFLFQSHIFAWQYFHFEMKWNIRLKYLKYSSQSFWTNFEKSWRAADDSTIPFLNCKCQIFICNTLGLPDFEDISGKGIIREVNLDIRSLLDWLQEINSALLYVAVCFVFRWLFWLTELWIKRCFFLFKMKNKKYLLNVRGVYL